MNSYLIAKTICAFLVSLMGLSNKVFEHLSLKKDPFNQIIKKWPRRGGFVDILEDI